MSSCVFGADTGFALISSQMEGEVITQKETGENGAAPLFVKPAQSASPSTTRTLVMIPMDHYSYYSQRN